MKLLYTCLLCVIIMISTLASCVPEKWAKYHPSSIPDTVWATKDNKVIIEIEDYSAEYVRVYINHNDEILELFTWDSNEPGEMFLINKESIEIEKFQPLEIWDQEVYEDKFVATVVETTYFNVGDVLTFYKIGENTNNDNHISYDDADKIATDAIPPKEYEQYVRLSRKETINGNDNYVFYASAQCWKCIGDDDWIHSEVITHWIYVDAITGEVYEVKSTGAKVNVTKEDALKEYNNKNAIANKKDSSLP